MQAGGQRFEPVRLHHPPFRVEDDARYSRDEDTSFALRCEYEGFALFFDIVNGFLIDAVMAG